MKFYLKFFLIPLLFCSLFAIPASAQTITVSNFDNSVKYAPGSSIGVPVTITNTAGNCIPQSNTFSLFLSNSSGVYPATPIATVTGFYITYINATIPAGTPAGTGYKLKVTSSSNPGATIVESPVFQVVNGTAINAGIQPTTSSPVTADGSVLGVCDNKTNSNFTLDYFPSNDATTGTTGSIVFVNESNGALTTRPSLIGSFTASPTNYTAIVKATNGTTGGTKAYTIVNNQAANSLNTNGNNSQCLVNGQALITYTIDPTNLTSNYPGMTYRVNWGDGSPATTYTICDLLASNGAITHIFTKSSCGNTPQAGRNSVFQVDVQPSSPFCGSVGTVITTYAAITVPADNKITGPTAAAVCSGTPITFTNSSFPGEDPNSTSGNCQNYAGAKYTWFLDSSPIIGFINVSINVAPTLTLTSGHHIVSIHLNNPANTNPDCVPSDYQFPICVQDPPKPSFTPAATTFCASAGLTVTNTSVIDQTCTPPVFNWTITPSAGVTTVGGTTLNSFEPKFAFTTQGIYTLTLSMPDACGHNIASTPVTLKVDASTALTLSPDISFCGAQTIPFSTATGAGKTTYSGTADPTTATYNWSISATAGAAAATFTSGNVSSQYPTIKFPGVGTYTVTATYTNSCGTITKTQNITIQQAPAVTITPATASVCASAGAYALTGAISDMTNVTGYTWKTNGDGSFNNATGTLTPVYTLGTADKTGHTVTITLDVKTNLVGACADVPQTMSLTVIPADVVTSASTSAVCSGNAVNYNITASQAGSTFSWTATGPATITGFSGGSNSTTISDVLTNSDPVNPGVVIYTITPTANGCTGTPFNLSVTVNPNPVLTFSDKSICSNTSASVTLGGTLKYKWTSQVMSGTATGNTQQATFISASGITDVLKNTGAVDAVVKYTVTPMSAAGCTGNPSVINITLYAPPTQPVFTPTSASVCNLPSYTLSGTVPVVGTGQWSEAAGKPVTFADATNPVTIVSGLVAGTVYNFVWKISTTCTSNQATFTLTDDLPSVGGTAATTPSTVCYNSNGTITLSGKTGNVTAWQFSTDGGTTWTNESGTNTGTSYNYTGLIVTTAFRAVVVNGSCSLDYSAPITVTVVPQAITPNAGPDQAFCNQTSATLQGNSPGTLIGTWTQKSGPTAGVVITSPNSAATTVTGLTPGNVYVFTWSISSACANNGSDVKITDDAPSVGGTASTTPSTVCYNSNGTITLTGKTGNVTAWQFSTDGGTTWTSEPGVNTGVTYAYTGLTVTTAFRAVVVNGTCSPANSSPVTVTVVPQTILPNAGSDQAFCNQTSATLQGNSPGALTGTWTQKSGPTAGVAITSPNSAATTVTGLTPGNVYVFTWSISSACANNGSDVKITDDAPSIGGTASTTPTTVCYNSNGTITLAGKTGNVTAWQFSTDGGTTWANEPGTNTGVTYNYTNLTATTAFRAVVVNGTCSLANSAPVTVTVVPQAIIPNAGPNQTFCNQTTATLQGNDPGLLTGTWTQKSGPTAGVVITSPNTPVTTITGLTPGNVYVFTWSISSSCANNGADVKITDDALSVGGTAATTPTTVCYGSNGTITLTGKTGNVTAWQSSTDGGTTWANLPGTNTTTAYNYTNLTITTAFRAVVVNGSCSVDYSSPVTVTVVPQAIIPNAGPDQAFCNQTITTLQGNSAGALTGLWTLKSGPSAGLVITSPSSPNTTVTGLIPGNSYIFTWTISSSCATDSKDVNIKDDALSNGGTAAASPSTVCYGANGTVTLSGYVGNVSAWQSSTDGGTTWTTITGTNTSPSYNYTTIGITTAFRAIVINGTCSSATSAPVTVNVIQPAVIANAGPNQILCNQTTITLAGNNPGISPGVWTLKTGPSAGLTITDPTNPTTTVTGVTPGNIYVFAWTITNSCGGTQSTVQITDDATSSGGTATTPANPICFGSNGSVSVSGIIGNVTAWQMSTDNGLTWQTIAGSGGTTYGFTNLTQTTSFRTIVTSGSCSPAVSSPVKITVNPATTIPNAGPDQTLCNQSTVTLQGNDPGIFAAKWVLKSGPSAGVVINNPTSPITTVSGLVGGNIYTFSWVIFGQAPCPDLSSDVQITNQSAITNTIAANTSTICAGSSVNIIGSTPTGGVAPYTFKWESSVDNGVTWAVMPGQTSRDVLVTPPVTTQYRRTVFSNAQICSYMSTPATVTVQSGLANNTINATSTGVICYNTSPGLIIGSTPTGGDGTYIYIWSQSIDGGTTFTDITGANAKDYTPGPLTKNTQFRRSVSTSLCVTPIASNVVAFNVTPPLIAKITAQDQSGCAPFYLNSSNISATPDNNAKTYSWYHDGKLIGTGITFPDDLITTAGTTAVIKLVVTSKLNCPDAVDSLTFTTFPQAQAFFTVDKNSGCGPTSVTITNTSTPINASSYTWTITDRNNKVVDTQNSTNLSPNPYVFQPDPQGFDQIYTVTLKANGCRANTYPQKITVYPAAPLPIIDPGALNGCSPYTAIVRNLTLGTNAKYDFYLTNANGVVLESQTKTDTSFVKFNTVLTTGNTATTYYIYMTATGPCGTQASTKKYPIVITPSGVTAKMSVTPINNNGQVAGCAPLLTTFHNLSTNGAQYYYNVYDSNFQVIVSIPAPDPNVDVNYNFDKPGTYYVDITVIPNCSPTPLVSKPQTQIIVYPVPAPSFSFNPTSGCTQLTTTFTNTTPDAPGAPAAANTYTWDFGDGSPVSHAFSPTHTYTYRSTAYTVTLTAQNASGCSNSVVRTDLVNVYPPPQTDFAAQPDTITTIPNYTFNFVDKSVVPGVSWLWDFGDKSTSVRQNPSHTYLDTGTYVVTLTSYTQYGCTDKKTHIVRILGVPGQLYVPNAFLPTSLTPELRVFTVKGSGLKSWDMRIFNIWGQLVFETTKLNAKGEPVEFWDGTIKGMPAQQGGYAWEISAEFINGTSWKGMSYNGGPPKRAGMLNLIR